MCRVSDFLRSRTSVGLRGLRTMNRTTSLEQAASATPPATRPTLARSVTSPAPTMVRLTASSGDQTPQPPGRDPEDEKIPASRQRPIVNAAVATARALAPNGQPRKVGRTNISEGHCSSHPTHASWHCCARLIWICTVASARALAPNGQARKVGSGASLLSGSLSLSLMLMDPDIVVSGLNIFASVMPGATWCGCAPLVCTRQRLMLQQHSGRGMRGPCLPCIVIPISECCWNFGMHLQHAAVALLDCIGSQCCSDACQPAKHGTCLHQPHP